ncbi:penicillin-binding protein [Flavitalea sp. BT771]|uniref:penicillin-binding protein n=1 Tax=Flavitalea sp. BT771 TaxID=3063329 RepID=UPI0026E45E1E|nr:penicillin-binding protein [Flavitalea sp. BT771]MDO6435490.1 penicillin-binding protein [Flavitalea sp. BT771]MDV6224390.1 penicillin-binding protein [Flavitalea sp. BT771]
MEVKRDILWRVYLCFIGITALCLVVLGKAFYIQRVQGAYWRSLSDSLHQKFIELDAERGTVYSEDSSMLSTSIPSFNIYIDFGADGLREKNGKRFTENLDSLSLCLAGLFGDQSSQAYKKDLQRGYRTKDRYYLLHSNLSFDQYKKLRSFPLVRQGRNKSGFIAEVNNKRLNPFGLLANRTIGLARANAQNVGLERTYDTLLKGQVGKRLVRYIAGGTYIPVEGYEIESENGKDIVTTLDVNIQDIAENALLKGMLDNEAEHGTCIVMEVGTGKVKAIANLGRQSDGTYWEDLNYAIRATEPGSTFKLATMLTLLEDHKIRLSDNIDLEGGVWKVARRTVYDSEPHENKTFTVKQAFEISSNVGMAKLAWANYAGNPNAFVDHLKKLKFNQLTGIDLVGETTPIIKTPKSRTWSATTLPWMAFGYEVLVSPLQTLTLYNAVANNGRMMKPYLVSAIQEAGITVRENSPETMIEKICSDATLAQLKECLNGVVTEGTGKDLFKGSFYKVAGKTGTALVANGNRGYADHIYQSSFAGYFPADHPKYSCIVVIKNKPFAKKYYGAAVAGPVFKELADKLMSSESGPMEATIHPMTRDSAQFLYAGSTHDMQQVIHTLGVGYTDSAGKNEWSRLYAANYQPVLNKEVITRQTMPDVKGMGLKDALFLLESMELKVAAKGRGKVRVQSIQPGSALRKNEPVTIQLD